MLGAWKTVSTVAIVGCWGLFGLVWAIGAAYNALRAPAVRQRSTPAYAWLVGAVGAWVILRAVPQADWNALRVHAWWLQAIGLPILLAATAFTLWARAAPPPHPPPEIQRARTPAGPGPARTAAW